MERSMDALVGSRLLASAWRSTLCHTKTNSKVTRMSGTGSVHGVASVMQASVKVRVGILHVVHVTASYYVMYG